MICRAKTHTRVPARETIVAEAAAIRAGWSDEERLRRRLRSEFMQAQLATLSTMRDAAGREEVA
jgi:hypothetical protein